MDWKSFLWGVGVGGLGAFFTGFLRKLGEDVYRTVKSKLFPEPPEPVRVDKSFKPSAFDPSKCVWVREGKVSKYEVQNYSFYPHPKNGGKCFRVTGDGSSTTNEYLMVAPDATKVEAL